jgi:hypothetical protein
VTLAQKPELIMDVGKYYNLNNAQAHLDFASSDTEAEGRALLLLLAFP